MGTDDLSRALCGSSVSLSADTAIIGAPYADNAGIESGSVYVFARSGTVWVQQQKVVASDADWGDSFGSSVSLSGDMAVKGAPRYDDAADDTGSASVFHTADGTWSQELSSCQPL